MLFDGMFCGECDVSCSFLARYCEFSRSSSSRDWMYCSCLIYDFFFFFSSRRRHTRYWRDWSSDVCSSDLAPTLANLASGTWPVRRAIHLTTNTDPTKVPAAIQALIAWTKTAEGQAVIAGQ